MLCNENLTPGNAKGVARQHVYIVAIATILWAIGKHNTINWDGDNCAMENIQGGDKTYVVAIKLMASYTTSFYQP